MQAPAYRLINPQADRSFVFKLEPFDLSTLWHYHPEVELIYFIEGKTSGVIGDGFQAFSEGDLVLLGSNFPHVLQEHTEYSRQHPGSKPSGLIIQFTPDFLGADFLQKPEWRGVKQLLQMAQRGLIFSPATTAKVAPTLLAMHTMSEPRKLLALLDVVQTLAECNVYRCLTPEHYRYDPSHDETRMSAVHEYVYAHFREPITIAQIASVASMTPTSFCRYFRTRTLKTFTRFLNEVRIAYACRQLNQAGPSISQVCFESGFNSLSYFNRQFRSIMHMSPQQYLRWKSKAVQVTPPKPGE